MEVYHSIVDLLVRPFVAWTILAGIIGQFAKTHVWSKERAKKHVAWEWMRKTMPLHPVVVGVVIGLFWPGKIEPGFVGGTVSGVLYFAISGAVSVWSYEVLKQTLKKYGLNKS